MTEMLYTLCESSLDFPPVDHALKDPNGLLAIGGNLHPNRIINAYRNGIFPWYSPDDPILWWSPDPRAIISTDKLKVNRTLNKVLKRQLFKVTVNKAFADVITECADETYRDDGTWIVDDMISAYVALHEKGFAQSIEVWQDDCLVGGLYGISINGYFSGESMFHRAPNASKVALVALVKLAKSVGIDFIDCQILNPFLESMGAEEISRDEFIRSKNAMLKHVVDVNVWRDNSLNDLL